MRKEELIKNCRDYGYGVGKNIEHRENEKES